MTHEERVKQLYETQRQLLEDQSMLIRENFVLRRAYHTLEKTMEFYAHPEGDDPNEAAQSLALARAHLRASREEAR